jgi:hypothetical protein
MYPLLRRENLTLQVLACLALWNWIVGRSSLRAISTIIRRGVWVSVMEAWRHLHTIY